MLSDMVLFLWHILQHPVYAAIAMATALTLFIVIANYLTFMFKDKD